jgi:carboxymethylenebutenolidase
MPVETATRTMEISTDGGSFEAYVATPAKGRAPAVVILQEIFGVNFHIRAVCDLFAQEGYIAVAPDLFWRIQPGIALSYTDEDVEKARACHKRFNASLAVTDIAAALKAVRAMPECDSKVGVVGFCLGGKLAFMAAARCEVDAAVCYYPAGVEKDLPDAPRISCPIIIHVGEKDPWTPPELRQRLAAALANHRGAQVRLYPDAGHAFANFSRTTLHKPSYSLAYSRTLALLRRNLGPELDLDALWDRHVNSEFQDHDLDATMNTMVAEPYVNHVPTLTGGEGQAQLRRFYKHHFLPKLPKDTRIIPLSRTVGADRVVDELILCFTHDIEVDFLLPGVVPTGRYVEIPTVAIVQFRGGKILNEHIYWDQATALAQIGAFDPKGLPVVGIEQSKKMLDEHLPANQLIPQWKDGAD